MIRPLRHVLAALACLALCAALLAACGGEDENEKASARSLLEETFGSGVSAIDNGRLKLAFQLDPEGLLALGGPIRLSLDGPFTVPGDGQLPQLDIDFATTLGREVFRGSALSTGRAAFVQLAGRSYRLDREFVAGLRRALADASAKKQPGLKALGIDPLRWISGARVRGEEDVAGVDTTRISGNVKVVNLLADIDRLLSKAGGGGAGGLLSPEIRKQISDGVKTARVDVWTGTEDKILRQLAVVIDFAFEGAQRPIPGLDAGKINLRLRLTDVNETKLSVQAPPGARPLSDLTGGTIGDFLRGIGKGLTGNRSSIAAGPFLQCITGAKGNSASLVSCISKLTD